MSSRDVGSRQRWAPQARHGQGYIFCRFGVLFSVASPFSCRFGASFLSLRSLFLCRFARRSNRRLPAMPPKASRGQLAVQGLASQQPTKQPAVGLRKSQPSEAARPYLTSFGEGPDAAHDDLRGMPQSIRQEDEHGNVEYLPPPEADCLAFLDANPLIRARLAVSDPNVLVGNGALCARLARELAAALSTIAAAVPPNGHGASIGIRQSSQAWGGLSVRISTRVRSVHHWRLRPLRSNPRALPKQKLALLGPSPLHPLKLPVRHCRLHCRQSRRRHHRWSCSCRRRLSRLPSRRRLGRRPRRRRLNLPRHCRLSCLRHHCHHPQLLSTRHCPR